MFPRCLQQASIHLGVVPFRRGHFQDPDLVVTILRSRHIVEAELCLERLDRSMPVATLVCSDRGKLLGPLVR